VPRLTTLITELVTALGMTGVDSLDAGLSDIPRQIVGVGDDQWAAVVQARRSGDHGTHFDLAFGNGQAFLDAPDGLRGRRPQVIEWKGEHKDPVPTPLPVDLRVDHVYLVSCKYGSKVLGNHSPQALFDGLLDGQHSRTKRGEEGDWYRLVAPEAYSRLWDAMRSASCVADLPADPAQMDKDQRDGVRKMFPGAALPPAVGAAYTELSTVVSRASAERLETRLGPVKDRMRERFLWRLLRIGTAPYFILGSSDRKPPSPFRLRIGTPWDVHQVSSFHGLVIEPVDAGQPRVNMTAQYRMSDGTVRKVAMHVEIRWSHGKFGGAPEAKVYLDSAPSSVPGYFPLEADVGQLAL
jgi:hypothetical protein